MKHGNWLQDLLHWYWLTPWQLGLLLGLLVIALIAGLRWIDRGSR